LSNDELVENCLILVQQLFSEELINSQERDHLKGNLIEPTQAFETQTAIACQN